MRKRALLVLNRKARQGQADVARALEGLAEAGIELLEEPADEPARLPALIRSYRGRADLVIIGGGDGTLNAAADGLVEAQLPLGVLPLGTANDLARTLGIPDDPASACRVIAEGFTRRIDLGWVNGKHFFNVASLGLSVQITRQLTRSVKGRWGVLAYLVTAIRVLLRARPFSAEIRANGQVYPVKTVQVAVGNGRHYGGGMTVAEEATIDDGLLHLYSLEVRRWWQLLPLLPALRCGTLARSSRVRTLQGREFEVVCRKPRRVNTDGELTGQTPAHFRLVPAALSVFVPRPEAPGNV